MSECVRAREIPTKRNEPDQEPTETLRTENQFLGNQFYK